MDTSVLEQAIADLKAKVAADSQALTADSEALKVAQEQLAHASLINALEALTADDVDIINKALTEASNSLNIFLWLPPTDPQEPSQEINQP